MNRKIKKILLILLISILMITNMCYADINTDAYKSIYNNGDTGKIIDLGGQVLGVVQVIAVATGIIMLVILGIKYMISSVEEKATIKQKLVPYVIGAFIAFASAGLLNVLFDLAQGF